MKSIKIAAVVSAISPTGVYTIVPVIKKERYWIKKSTGQELNEQEIEGIASSDLQVESKLLENSDFWSNNPSMNFRLAPDNESGREALRAGDVLDISITKR